MMITGFKSEWEATAQIVWTQKDEWNLKYTVCSGNGYFLGSSDNEVKHKEISTLRVE